MKKLLLALGLSLSTSVIYAQNNTVTVYGIIDTGIQSGDFGAGRVSRMADSQIATSRLGFRGTEDLGNGLRANFQLEGQLNPSAGSMGSTTVATNEIFNRDSYVGLGHKNLGELRIGRTDVARAGEVDVFITLPVGGNFAMMPINGTGIELGTDQKNVVSYFSPTVKGWQIVIGQTQAANGATTAATDKQTGATLIYSKGSLKLAAGRQVNDGIGEAKRDANTIGGSYDFGNAIFALAYAEGDTSTTGNVTSKSTVATIKVPLKNNFAVNILYGNTIDGSKSADGKGNGYGIIITNALSKRTSIYASYTQIDNQSQSSMRWFNSSAPVSAGQNTNATGLGIIHSF